MEVIATVYANGDNGKKFEGKVNAQLADNITDLIEKGYSECIWSSCYREPIDMYESLNVINVTIDTDLIEDNTSDLIWFIVFELFLYLLRSLHDFESFII